MTLTSIKTNRRRLLKGAAFAVAAPAVIGRALVTDAKAAFAGESLIAVSWSGNYEQVFRDTVIAPFNASAAGTRW
jgi:spermidine/putrescine transport system substrate-binding protein